uniref:Uncharacterized protein n=1 Tax=Amphimedon queenslandica TaxID=400682 RepID=A0A1X7UJ92_AMPQE
MELSLFYQETLIPKPYNPGG